MRTLLVAASLALMAAPASAAQFIAYISVTGSDLAHFEELGGQFPGAVEDSFVGRKGTYPVSVSCANGFSDPATHCISGTGAIAFDVFTAGHLDSLFSTGGGFGYSGVDASDFWLEFHLTTNDTVLTTFHRDEQGQWSSPLAPGAVPEPAAWALMLVGFGGLGMMLRRRSAVPT